MSQNGSIYDLFEVMYQIRYLIDIFGYKSKKKFFTKNGHHAPQKLRKTPNLLFIS